ncbi:MAG: 30S ribosomal protein S21 [Thermodesulfobacteriota bacterium]
MAGVTIKVRQDESFEKALRRFRKQVDRSGVMKEMKRHMQYEKPSVKRKRKALSARKRWIRRMKRTSRGS